MREFLGVTIVGGLNFSRLRKLSMELVTYLGSDRLGNPRRRQSGGGTVNAVGTRQ